MSEETNKTNDTDSLIIDDETIMPKKSASQMFTQNIIKKKRKKEWPYLVSAIVFAIIFGGLIAVSAYFAFGFIGTLGSLFFYIRAHDLNNEKRALEYQQSLVASRATAPLEDLVIEKKQMLGDDQGIDVEKNNHHDTLENENNSEIDDKNAIIAKTDKNKQKEILANKKGGKNSNADSIEEDEKENSKTRMNLDFLNSEKKKNETIEK